MRHTLSIRSPASRISADQEGVAHDIAERFNAVVLLKGKESVLAGSKGATRVHRGGSVGPATGGSGDVLAGVIGGIARP